MKAILIEDRVYRQKNILGEKLDVLNNFSSLKNISGGKEFNDIVQKFDNKEFALLETYSVIMLHRSAFDTSTRNSLIEFLSKSKKKLVFFSGGITGSQISKISSLEFLLINVNQFYSENLFYFLNNGAQNLLELAFGKDWQLSNLIDAFEKLVLYSKSFNNQQPYTRIEEDLMLNSWVKDNYFKELQQKSLVDRSELLKVSANIQRDLEKLLR